MAKSTRILRLPQIYGRGGKIPVSRTIFLDNYVYREGGDEFIPGTTVRRLRLAKLGERAVGGFEDEIDEIVEGLRAERDTTLVGTRERSKQQSA
jgi:hypothetical protein